MIKVSVFITTYNQEKYIAQAIESALNQQTNFSYEILIGEDCSTDNTRKIVKDYAIKYPNKIRTFLYEKNIGGHANVDNLIKAAKGQYLAWLEGDDYWRDPKKLQKQADILDKHKDVVISCHNVAIVDENSRELSIFYKNIHPKKISNISKLILGNFIHTPSCVFRNNIADITPNWIHQLSLGDWPRHLILSQYGKIHYIPDIMAAYRKTNSGVWSHCGLDYRIEKTIEVLHAFNLHTNYVYDKIVQDSLKGFNCQLINNDKKENSIWLARIKYLFKIIREKINMSIKYD